ncbi:MAG: hypothetical protein DRP93_01435 [Candidatus Neomarinimicrobiota bacterium]|nr:MAG: hypothetical protein DRP93_01435 [Candidatus Neomarinimicrobiota bacterium]
MAMLYSIPQAQTLILTDTLVTVNTDTIFLKWYHLRFVDSDDYGRLVSAVSLHKQYTFKDSIYTKTVKRYKYDLMLGDSIKNPNGTDYFTYTFVKNYIYSNGENMKRTLSLYQLLNRPDRVFE